MTPDLLGRELEPLDTVAWSSSRGLRIGTVHAVAPGQVFLHPTWRGSIQLEHYGRGIWVPSGHVVVLKKAASWE